ncbi:MAG TPA: cytochrome C assembly protein [Nitrospirae bacterium]|nr:heme exporter protein C [bacterium BMS3Abin09]GBE40781.1 heme exporter protein C [bacterium BMS3Bbin09]HDH34482.1 cytochrome C assembly protein [Nitrospirota bacterium]HDO67185.1 cytochrome C assembly protein [Nitrospirota bacterium]HDZ84340.1 cytochrome C assembly protein [Nitrospirota bacterium]
MKTDRSITIIFLFLLVMIPLNFYLIFMVAPTEKVMGEVQRIFYLHISLAVGAFLALTGVFVSSILFLWKKKFIWDTAAYTCAEIGVLMSTLVLTTGSIWARPIWNAWWTWDPRLLTVLILWFIYIGYFLLRGGIADKFKKAQYSAVLGIIGYIDIPVVRYATKWWKSIHPLLTQEGGGLDPVMKNIMFFSMATFILLTIFLFLFRFRLARIEERLEIVKKRMED